MKVDFGRDAANARVPGLDAFRGCFVVLMFAAHVARFADRGPSTLLARFFELVLWIEPAISAGFLLVVGVSLELSWSRAGAVQAAGGWRRWYLRLLIRALTLYLVAVVLFVSQYGFELPDALLSPDILSAIAAALVTVGLALRAGSRGLLVHIALVFVVVGLLQASGGALSGLNAGPGGALPLIAFTALGVGLARWSAHFDKLFLISLGVTALASLLHGPPVARVESQYSTGPVTFWNHSLKGALLLAAPLVGTAWLFFRSSTAWRHAALGWVRYLGRHALLAYLTHLVLLEGSRRSGVFPLSAASATAYLVLLVILVCAVLWLAQTPRPSAWLNRAGKLVGIRF